jgi:hypothetical protein
MRRNDADNIARFSRCLDMTAAGQILPLCRQQPAPVRRIVLLS